MPTHSREQRQLLLHQAHGYFEIVLLYKEHDDSGPVLSGETHITEHNIHSWKIVQSVLDGFTNRIMAVKFEDGVLKVRYLCADSDEVFRNIFDYLVSLYEAKQEE